MVYWWGWHSCSRRQGGAAKMWGKRVKSTCKSSWRWGKAGCTSAAAGGTGDWVQEGGAGDGTCWTGAMMIGGRIFSIGMSSSSQMEVWEETGLSSGYWSSPTTKSKSSLMVM